MKNIFFNLAILLLVAGCAPLKPVIEREVFAENIQVVEYLKPSIRDRVIEVDMVKCKLGDNARTLESNIEACDNDMANQAFALGGDIVYSTPEMRKIGGIIPKTHYQEGLAPTTLYVESNRVDVRGIVYKIR